MSEWRTNRRTGRHFRVRARYIPSDVMRDVLNMVSDSTAPVNTVLMHRVAVNFPVSELDKDFSSGMLFHPQKVDRQVSDFIETFQRNPRSVPPIVVWYDSRPKFGYYKLIDGWHRVMAANELGLKTIPAIVISDEMARRYEMLDWLRAQ